MCLNLASGELTKCCRKVVVGKCLSIQPISVVTGSSMCSGTSHDISQVQRLSITYFDIIRGGRAETKSLQIDAQTTPDKIATSGEAKDRYGIQERGKSSHHVMKQNGLQEEAWGDANTAYWIHRWFVKPGVPRWTTSANWLSTPKPPLPCNVATIWQGRRGSSQMD